MRESDVRDVFSRRWLRHGLFLLLVVSACLFGGRRLGADPSPDPAGIATGDRASVYDAGGNAFVPAQPTAEDQAAAAREPLAMKLADAVGHVRVGANFSWTLSTGYLVLFMQAGFALLTCGLVRKKNAGHLMMLNFAAYVFAFLAYYVCGYAFQFGAVAVNAAP